MSGAARLRIVARWLSTGGERGAVSLALGPGWAAVRPQLLALLLLLAANITVLLVVTLPAYDRAAAAGSASRAGQQATETLEPVLQRARLAYGKVLDAEAGLADLRARVGASSGSVSEVVATLRAAIDAAGVSAGRIGYQPQPLEELGLVQLQVDIPVRGRYREIREFLGGLIQGPAFLVVERIGVSTPSETDLARTLVVQLGASVFIDPGAADPDAPAAPGQVSSTSLASAAATSAPDAVALAESLRQRLASLPPIPLPAGDFELHSERLDRPLPSASATSRNLFAFARDERAVAATVSEPEPVDDFVPEPVMPYQLLGITRTTDGLLATLSDGDHVHVLGEGELLPDGYRIIAIDLVATELQAGDRVVRLSLRKQDNQ